MRISIVSNGITYTENIAPIASNNQNKVKETSENVEDFSKLLEEFKDKIVAEIAAAKAEVKSGSVSINESSPTTSSALPPYTGKIPELLSEKSVEKIIVGQTKEGYESIAPAEYQGFFKEAAETYGIDQKLIELIGFHESRFLPDVTSSSGAMGIMQLMPETAKDMGVANAYDAYQNIMGGTKLLRQLSDAYGGDLDLMLSAYSAGMGAVKKYEGIPPYEETVNYIEWIRERYS